MSNNNNNNNNNKSNKKRVLCVGNNVIDFIMITPKYPEEDTDRRCLNGYWQRGGNASNNCTVLKNLGADVEIFTMLSNSAAFRVLLEDMNKRDILHENCPRSEKDPPFSSVILAQDTGTRTIVHCNMDYPYVSGEDFKRRLDLQNYGWVHFEARRSNETLDMMRIIQNYNDTNNRKNNEKIIISLDFEKAFDAGLKLCNMVDYLVFSKDLAIEQGWTNSEIACRRLADKLDKFCTGGKSESRNRPTIICPWGSQGVGSLDHLNNWIHVEACKIEKIVDTLGAGDVFMAAFIFATYNKEFPLAQAVAFANRTAGLKCGQRGYDQVAEVLKE